MVALRDVILELEYYRKLVLAWRRRRLFSHPEAVSTPYSRERRNSHPRSRYTPYIDNDRSFEEIAELFGLQPKDLMRFVEEADVPEPGLRRFGLARAPRLSDAYSDGIFREMASFVIYGFVMYLLTRLMKPKLVVETGVEGGLVDFCVLMALMRNERESGAKGKMVSFDLEPYPESGKYIPRGLMRYWHLIDGDCFVTVPEWLRKTESSIDIYFPSVDLVVHSGSILEGISGEIAMVESNIRPGGLLVDPIYSVHWILKADDPFWERYSPVAGFHEAGSSYKARVWQKR